MTGKLIGGEEAERIGLANRVAPAEELDEAVQGLVDELLACAPVAVGLAKRVMDASAKPALAATLELEVTMQERCAATADFAEGARGVPREAPAGVQRPLTGPRGDSSTTWPTSTGSGCSATPKRVLHAGGDLVRERHQLGGGGAAAVDERERVLGGDADAAVAVALVEAGLLDQPRGRDLDAPVGLGPGRRAVGRRVEDRVGEERAGADRVGVGGVDDHALAAPQREHGLADVGQRRAAADRDVERARQLGVAQRARDRRLVEPEGDRQHDAAVVVLEHAAAVDEAALGGGHLLDATGLAVEHAHGLDGLGHLLPVGADVLDRRRADRARGCRTGTRSPAGPSATHIATSGSHSSPAARSAARRRAPRRA